MRLTLALLKHPHIRNVRLGTLRHHINGSVNKGKHQIFEPICPWDKHGAMDHLISDQKNLEVLSRPFVTPKEEGPKGVAKVRGGEEDFIRRKSGVALLLIYPLTD